MEVFLGGDWFVDVAEPFGRCRCRAPTRRRATMQPRRLQHRKDGIDGGDGSWDGEWEERREAIGWG